MVHLDFNKLFFTACWSSFMWAWIFRSPFRVEIRRELPSLKPSNSRKMFVSLIGLVYCSSVVHYAMLTSPDATSNNNNTLSLASFVVTFINPFKVIARFGRKPVYQFGENNFPGIRRCFLLSLCSSVKASHESSPDFATVAAVAAICHRAIASLGIWYL